MSFWQRKKRVTEFDEEVATHLKMATQDRVERGATAVDADRAARREFGNVELVKEVARDVWGWRWLSDVADDVRYGFRMLGKNPGFTSVVVLTLAVAIGANTAIFSMVNAALLRPLPYPNHERLMRIEERLPVWTGTATTYATFLDLERESKNMENAAAYRPWVFNLTGEGEPEQVPGALVSASFFLALGSAAESGRVLNAEDDVAGGNNRVAVLSFALWRRRFGANPGITGKTIQVNAEPYTVIGIMPPGFSFPEHAEMWCPLVAGGALHENRRAHLLTVVADLRQGARTVELQGELTRLAKRIETENSGVADPGLTLAAVSLQKSLAAPVRPALLILLACVALFLLVACANIANLLFTRGAARQKEMGIRLAIGAGRWRIARQLLTENAVVGVLGGAIGLGIAAWGLRLIHSLGGEDYAQFGGINLDWRVVGYTLLVSMATVLMSGLGPALAGQKVEVLSSLKESSGRVYGGKTWAPRELLIAAQFAAAVVLLVSAGLLSNSFVRLLRVNPGFATQNLLTMELFLSPSRFQEGDPRGAQELRAMVELIGKLPGVRSAGLVTTPPITGGPSTDIVLLDRPAPPAGNEPSADIQSIDPNFFRTMGIPVVAGREFTERDTSNSARVMIISQRMAREFWPNENPLGKRVTMKDWGPPLTGEVVGVVGDLKNEGLDAATQPTIYWPDLQFPLIFNTIVLRTEGDPRALIPAVKSQIWSIDKDQPISRISTMDEIIHDSLARRRLYMTLLGTFAIAALLLAALGIYGVMSYAVTQRTHEMGIRMALGAERQDMMRMVIGRGAMVALMGVGCGVLLALGLTRWMTSLLFTVSAADPITFVSAAIVLIFVAAAACYVPARKATKVDPMVALRYE